MRATITLILGIIAVAFVYASVRQTSGESVQAWFGERPLERNAFIARYAPERLNKIRLTRADGSTFTAIGSPGRWQMLDENGQPLDRANPELLQQIIEFTLASTVVDSMEREDIDLTSAGLTTGHVRIELFHEEQGKIVDLVVGNRTPWKLKIKDSKELMQTVYVRDARPDKEGFVYVGTDPFDTRDLLDGSFDRLRDYHPLRIVDPQQLQEIQIESADDLVTLTRADTSSPWSISKPLDLRIDGAALKALVEGIGRLSAETIDAATTAAINSDEATRITIRQFDSEDEQVLTLAPPADGATTVTAVVAGRDATFHLPLASVNTLPLSLNALRYKFITAVNPSGILAIELQGTSFAPVYVSRPNTKMPWHILLSGADFPGDARAVDRFFSVFNSTPVTAFALDTAPTDYDATEPTFARYGLDKPAITARILGMASQGLVIHIGATADGKYYAYRTGQPHIYEISPTSYTRLPRFAQDWRDRRLWDLAPIDIKAIARQRKGSPAIELTHNYYSSTWTAQQGDQDVFPQLDLPAANRYLQDLETLEVVRWLPTDDYSAVSALRNPIFRTTIVADDPVTREPVTHTLAIAPTSTAGGRNFYGILSSDPHLFIIDLDTAKKLTRPLIKRGNVPPQ